MRYKLNNKDYVAFARKFVKETVDRMGIEEPQIPIQQLALPL